MNSLKRMPAEWEQQDAIILTWPHHASDWSGSLPLIEPVYKALVQQITRFETVLLLCQDEETLARAKKFLASPLINRQRILFTICKTDDVWARDYGPLTIYAGDTPLILDFNFNGWAEKYPYDQDNLVTANLIEKKILKETSYPSIDFIIEGGSVETDGQGTLLTTRSCLLQPKRYHSNETEVEGFLAKTLHFNRFLWLSHGRLAGDDTDGHIDTLARFSDPQTICYASCNDKTDEHYESLYKMAEELKQFRTIDGDPYHLIPLPIPKAIYNQKNQRLPATYANFLIINHAVLLPTYHDSNDGVAIHRLSECFPDREIIPIDARAIIQEFGSLHCLTMQLPKGSLA